MNNLDVLAQNRDALLLAEVIGWLHDYRKCSDEHLKSQAAKRSGQNLPRNELSKQYPNLSRIILRLPVQSAHRAITDLLDDRTWNNDPLGQFLSRCHRTAHFDKQEPIGGKQDYPDMQISSPFGFEMAVPGNLTSQLWSLPWSTLVNYSSAQRDNLRHAVASLFSQTIADTRRPINEVDLWNWGLLVGALYKAALAGALLSGNTPAAKDLRWRLLNVRVNGLDFLLNVVRIPDLLARQQILSDSLDKVRRLLEVTYPVGSEVYRDEHGSIFVVPDMPNLLQITDGSGSKLQALILQEFSKGTLKTNKTLRLGGEIMPLLELEKKAWWGQDPNWPNSSNNELPGVSAFLSRTITTSANAREIEIVWSRNNGCTTDICTVCGLRPQGPSKKAAERKVCDLCEERREDRSKEWATSQSDRTIWTDEVADTNGRLALIVGQFDLTHWLDGSLLDSLLLIAPHDPQNVNGEPITSKMVSFSRLRRIWETTRRFWQEAQAEILKILTDDRRRLKIYLSSKPDLGPFHVYDFDLSATVLSVVWVPLGNDGYLISADNLGYIAKQLGAKANVYDHPATAAIFVEDYLREQFVKNGRQLVLQNLDAQANQVNPNLLPAIRIARVEYQENKYATATPILAEPRTFMMLIPADKSLQILGFIKQKYENEMGKVRDRLPLRLGVVYANRRTPIRAVLDAGRSMLDYRSAWQQWKIKSISRQTQSNGLHFSETALLELERDGRKVTWRIPLKMMNGITDDRWYPYVFLETGGDDSKADEANRCAVKKSRPVGNGRAQPCWVVHTGDLRADETIYVMPSTFDFEFLDTTSRRFDICYDQNGRRPRPTRPFYLEDMDRLEKLWDLMKHLAVSQRHQVIRTIEATREAWHGTQSTIQAEGDKVFRQFVADTLAGAEWPKDKDWSALTDDERNGLIEAGVRGELADLAELHMEILKEC